MKNLYLLSWMLMFCIGSLDSQNISTVERLQGSWKSDHGVLIISGNYFSFAEFDASKTTFEGTYGGSFTANQLTFYSTYEFHTQQPDLVGETESVTLALNEENLTLGNASFERIDDGKPGALHGAWLITGRMRDGEISERTPGARKTMKILSGTRFQWIAYNSETADFSGTGGGTYTTKDGKYTENIEFFSRDSSLVGAALTFDFDIKDGKWHHSGKSSRGDPMYEVWSLRSSLAQ